MSKWIKNADTSDHIWAGQFIAAGTYYQIQKIEENLFASSSNLIAAIASGDAVVAYDDTGSNDIANISNAIDYLKGSIVPEFDEFGNQIVRTMLRGITPSGQKPTGGRYQAMSYEITVDHAAGTWKDLILSWPYPISIFSTEWINKANLSGDVVRVVIGEDTITGVLTADAAIGSTVLNVSSTVTDNARAGYKYKLYDGVNQDDLGRVTAVDGTAGTITVETATTNAFAAATPSYLQQTVEFIPHLMLEPESRVELAKDVVGGSYLASNIPLKISYQNNEGTTTNKVFSFVLEYKY